jgi:hypothetical protein
LVKDDQDVMIAVMSTRHDRIFDHVREYLARHKASSDGAPTRRRRAEVERSDIQNVQTYVTALEQVLDGIDAHKVHLREKRWDYTRSIKIIRHQARGPAKMGSYVMADYQGAVRVYVHALETQLRTGKVPDDVLENFRTFYEQLTPAAERVSGQTPDVDEPNTQD